VQPTQIRVEPLTFPVVGCRIQIPQGTWIVDTTDPDRPAFSRSLVSAPVLRIEPQEDGTDWVWWSASGGYERAGVWSEDHLLSVPGWLPKSFYRTGPPLSVGECRGRPCLHCGEGIPRSRRLNARFCSGRCKTAAGRARRVARQGRRKKCPVVGCKRYGFCRKHYPNSHRARAQYWGVLHEPITPSEVYERDGWTCGLCLLPVDKRLKHPDPMSVSLDHILPLSRGGDHLWANVQCSHLVCNLRKHNRV
jgi:5-methylcytosine-specific restriction endonuclease McrA